MKRIVTPLCWLPLFLLFGLAPALNAQVVINEVDADQASTDAAEFVELYGTPSLSLNGYVLVFYNGDNPSDVSYLAVDLDGQSLGADGFFVYCGDAANVSNCDLEVGSGTTNLIQNGEDAVALYLDDATSFPNGTLPTATNIVDALVYDTNDPDDVNLLTILTPGQPQINEAAVSGTTQSNSRLPDGGTPLNTSTYIQRSPTPGTTNDPPPALAEIFEVQGSGAASPFDGVIVTTEDNIVTAVGPNSFAIQTPDARDDADPATSNGILVYTGSAPTVSVGDCVDVTGEVDEFFGMTEFTSGPVVTVVASCGPVPTAIQFNAALPSPNAPGTDFEPYEGMLVEIASGVISGPNQGFGSDPIAEVYITAGASRAYREPGIESPGGPPTWDGNPEVFEMDVDKFGLPNDPIYAGSTFSATGIIGYEFGDYELFASTLNVTPPAFADEPAPVRDPTASEVMIGSLNLFRLFNNINDPGPEDDDTILDTQEYETRLAKFSAFIRGQMKAPDIVGVQEVERLSVLQDLADEIQTDGGPTYTPYVVEGNDIGGIDVGYLVNGSTVGNVVITQLGAAETYINPITSLPETLHDRPPLLLEGDFTATTPVTPVKVLNVHQRSLGGIEGSEAIRVKTKRSEQAKSVANMVQARQGNDLVVIGDFNAYEFTDGYVDVLGQITGTPDPLGAEIPVTPIVTPALTNQVLSLPAADRYSFIFNGSAQVLDHILTSSTIIPSAAAQASFSGSAALAVNAFDFARGNADAAETYLDSTNTILFSSDHDGTVLYLELLNLNVKVAADVFLAGPYAGAGVMNTDLNMGGLLPLAQPYNVAPWNYAGTETIAAAPATMADWVLVHLYTGDPMAPPMTIEDTAAGLLHSDGTITDVDGTSPLSFSVSSGSYYVVVDHRNHLSAMTDVAVALSSTSTMVSFDGGAAFGSNAMIGLGGGVYGLWGGDGDANDSTTAFDFLNEWLPVNGGPSGYHSGDFDMNGSPTAFDFLNVWLPANGQASQVPLAN